MLFRSSLLCPVGTCPDSYLFPIFCRRAYRADLPGADAFEDAPAFNGEGFLRSAW